MKLFSIDQGNNLRIGDGPEDDLAAITFQDGSDALSMVQAGEAVCVVDTDGPGYRWLFGEELHTEMGKLKSGGLSYRVGVDPSDKPGTAEIRWFEARFGSVLVKRAANGTLIGIERSAATATAALGAEVTPAAS